MPPVNAPITVEEELQASAALYALGALTQHEARALESHLAESGDSLAAEVNAFTEVVSLLALSAPEQMPAPALRERLLSQVSGEVGKSLTDASLPAGAAFYNLRAHEGAWRELSPGVSVKFLFHDQVNGTLTSLLKLAPGAKLETHFHSGKEQCYILSGDFCVNGEAFGPGDFHVALPGSTHQIVSSTTGAVSLIIAPEQYEPLS